MNNLRKSSTLLILAIIINSSFYVRAQNPDFVTVSTEIKIKFESKRKQIVEEISNTNGNEWTGEYWAQIGSMDGASFNWSPVSGFIVRSGNDFHRGIERINYGNANFNGNVLTLSSEYLEKDQHTYPVSNSFVPVKWDKQHWLIPTDKIIQFIYAVNSGVYDEISSFFVKYEDIKKPNNGLPHVPQAYQKYFSKKPIKAKVVELKFGNKNYFDYKITLNAGKNQGVVEEMKFYLINVKNFTTKIEVVKVSESSSTARIVSVGSSGEYNDQIKSLIGSSFSSKMPNNY